LRDEKGKTTHHPLKNKKKDPTTWSHACSPPLGKVGGVGGVDPDSDSVAACSSFSITMSRIPSEEQVEEFNSIDFEGSSAAIIPPCHTVRLEDLSYRIPKFREDICVTKGRPRNRKQASFTVTDRQIKNNAFKAGIIALLRPANYQPPPRHKLYPMCIG